MPTDTSTPSPDLGMDIDLEDSYRAGRDRHHDVVLDPRPERPRVEVWHRHGIGVPVELWTHRVLRIGTILDGCADTSRIVAVLTRRAPDLLRLAAAHETCLDRQSTLHGRYAGTEDEVAALEFFQREISDEIDEAARAAPAYWEAAVYFDRVDWSEIDPRTGTLDFDLLTDQIVAAARADDVYLDPADVTGYLRERLAREVEQAHEAALEEVCAYADCYSLATTTDGDGDPCCAAHAQTTP